MGYTIYEKILQQKSGKKEIKQGDLFDVQVDRVMIHDFFTPFCIDKFYEMGFKNVFDPHQVVIVYDHLVPAVTVDDVRHYQITEKFISDQGLVNVHRSDGVCHQLMHEAGYVKPGDIVLGTDSHTVTYGALGVLATGIGYTEMAGVLGTGRIWVKAVPTIRINIEGTLNDPVSAKDVILTILGDIKADGASYKVLEFGGSAVKNMSIAGRLTLSNMSVEAGAKAGLIEVDEKTVEYLKSCGIKEEDIVKLAPDEDAVYEKVLNYKAEDIVLSAACPHNVDNLAPVSELTEIKVNQAFLGSCTNGRLEDLEIAARVLKGKKVHPGVRFYVVPASRKIYRQALEKGYLKTLVQAGAILNHPSCSLCAGRSGGVCEDGDTVIASNNRNFLGRMGGKDVQIYLASPAVVAASAIKGYITGPVL